MSQKIFVIKMTTNNKSINVIRIYVPEDCNPEKDKDDFHDEVHTIVKRELKKNGKLVLMRDSNARIGGEVIPGIK